jgi:hypothetical protein
MDHTGLLNGFAPGRRAAQTVHSDGKKYGSGLRCDIQNITIIVSLVIVAIMFSLFYHFSDLFCKVFGLLFDALRPFRSGQP